jgi:hypothetical protein
MNEVLRYRFSCNMYCHLDSLWEFSIDEFMRLYKRHPTMLYTFQIISMNQREENVVFQAQDAIIHLLDEEELQVEEIYTNDGIKQYARGEARQPRNKIDRHVFEDGDIVIVDDAKCASCTLSEY